jgi:hypothetical protein
MVKTCKTGIKMNFTYDDTPTKTLLPATRDAISKHLIKLAEEKSLEDFPVKHREHLGVSVIGDPCSRRLWYGFRWVRLELFSGRMRRLFNVGHKEEENFQKLLMWMGFFIREIDPATDKQYKFSSLNGHYGGSGDTIALMPWFKNEDDRILVEYKTHNKKSFEHLVSNKLVKSKPKHFAQMCGYGKAFHTRYGLYCAYNKDDSDYYFELIELDWQFAQQLENKAFDIIVARIAPSRISDNPSYFECKYCHFNEICHYGANVEKNCRSCKQAIPTENAKWICTRFNMEIPNNFIPNGCEYHVSINS